MKDVFPYSPAQVTEAFRNRDIQIFQELYKAYSEELYLLAHHWVKDSDLARDIVHNLFVHLWEKADQVIIEGQVKHYLFRAVSNRSLNELKRRKRHVGEELLQFQADEQSFHHMADYVLFQRELMQHLQGLPPRCREIFLLSRIHGLEPAEIASQLNISLNTVYFQLSIALKSLRVSLLGKKKL
ncbi:RNA polymerase sigma-70 factor (ECF subfamily) [Chitinophaga dinghuensis]|uniref:RNA polymerase sigma-70 factor (ECF subfamily) n=1 Tax=Chitinophaga dinghuensis TaxID=1539050 RepID=A0A327VU27_9BACT|nr:RNA polymerase sigma-70 factor [Chitinophaga dinghuensis]RAJ77560.1 RNA polymerase sigma-70 factor (ECF subfamily) [Chitinophaga dinghuensis]